jgi:formyltetrahydrofolate-dependent phosphoribosylglycinamide formyltransferase/phosphoribosylaminoimidazole-succinocarboxamide synthase
MWTAGMGGSTLGVWVSHGEGQFTFPNKETQSHAVANGLVPFCYAADDGSATEAYPMNPNGSPGGIASLCSADGRHMAMMPHPERTVQTWNWPWVPDEMSSLKESPWMRLFQNARAWCDSSSNGPASGLSLNPKLAVLISGSGTTLQSLIDRISSGELNAEIVLVVSSKADAFGLERATQAGIATAVVASKTYRKGGVTDWSGMSSELFAQVEAAGCNLAVCAGYMCKLEISAAWEKRVLNVHPSLIPKFCGAGFYGDKVHAAVIEAGETVSGCTVHFLDNEYDHGPIVSQATCSVDKSDTLDSLRTKVQALEKVSLAAAINELSKTNADKIRERLGCVTGEVLLEELGTPFKGKVRDIYMTEKEVVMVTSDRVSAFDFILPNLIPFKGWVLNKLSQWTMKQTTDIVPNALALVQHDPSVIVQKRMKNIGVEAICRGYLWGSMAGLYEKGERSICGLAIPDGLLRHQKLAEPLFTPTTKAEMGDHDENMTQTEVEALCGVEMAAEVKRVALALFARGQQLMATRGLILLDTKYEFGTDADGKLHVIDEVNTPDSSRMCSIEEYAAKWPKIEAEMATGAHKNVAEMLKVKPELKIKEFSKQYVRDALIEMGFDGTKAIKLSEEQVVECSNRYIGLFERITGDTFPWPTLEQSTESAVLARISRNLKAAGYGRTAEKEDDAFEADKPKHECGIAMLRLLKPLPYYVEKYGTDRVGLDLMYFMLEKQRNRGQDGAGIAGVKLTTDPGQSYMEILKSNAKDAIGDLFQLAEDARKTDKDSFDSELLLGHVRYGTFGGNRLENLHPFVRESNWRSRALLLAGNYNLTNIDELFQHLVDIGMHPRATSDTVTCMERIGHFLDEENMCQNVRLSSAGHKPRRGQRMVEESINIARVLSRASCDWDGGFAMAGVIGHGDAFVLRDRHGIRPAYWWANDEFAVCASERAAIATVFDAADWQEIQEVKPGHALIIKKSGTITQEQVLPVGNMSQCIFERIYFSRPTDPGIYQERKRLGNELASIVLSELEGGKDLKNAIVTFVPNSSEVACIGFLDELQTTLNTRGLPRVAVDKLIVKDSKLRTFIQSDETRNFMSRHAYEYTPSLVKRGESVVVAIDDSIVRGTTLRESIIARLDQLGPKKIIFVSSAPQIRYPDFYGIDMARLDNLIAFRACIELIKDNGKEAVLSEVYEKCKRALAEKDDPLVNHVQRIYDGFTPEDVSTKIGELVCTPDTKAIVKVIFQTVEGTQRAIGPGHSGDWVFTGNYPTTGGLRCAMRAYVFYYEGVVKRPYLEISMPRFGANVLVLGSGGREHAISWKLKQSSKVGRVYVAPGNAGTSDSDDGLVKNVDIKLDTANGFQELIEFCKQHNIDMVVVGPEQPLVDGVSDALRKIDMPVFGPSQTAAELESSKAWSKEFMTRAKVPTATFAIFKSPTPYEKIVSFVEAHWPVVVKASGLAAGKGVLIPTTKEEAVAQVGAMLAENGQFGAAGSEVVVEKRLMGREVSFFGLSDGTGTVRLLPPSQDYKRAYVGDEGPNTGGMGSFSPAPASPEVLDFVKSGILEASAKGMLAEGRPFVGVFFVGAMFVGDVETAENLRVLEYNVRFGDPETQSVMAVLEADLFELFKACTSGTLNTIPDNLHETSRFACSVVMASGGYPGSYPKNKTITGLEVIDIVPDTMVFHAGTKLSEVGVDGRTRVSTSGGRVLAITATANTLASAVQRAYVGVRHVRFDGCVFRTDIAAAAITSLGETALSIENSPSSPNRPSRDGSGDAKIGLTYLAAGVDIDAGNATVEGLKPFVKSTARPGCEMDGAALSFGGFCDLKNTGYKDPILVSGTDGVGTKLKVADVMGKHDTIGIDLVAMCVNDVLVHGAEPLFFLDYFACGKLEVPQALSVIKGIADGCKQAGCALIGGETAEMPGMYSPGEYDVAGFAVAAVERDSVMPRMEKIASGDVLIGLSSSGVHSNGFSLARKILSSNRNPSTGAQWSFRDTAPFDSSTTLGDALLTPTRIYVKSMLPLVRSGKVIAAAHITGGGLLENIPRVLPTNLTAKLFAMKWQFPPLFCWMMEEGGISWSEMARTFNCGIGMVLVVKAGDVDSVLQDLGASGEEAQVIGHLEEKDAEGESVLIEGAMSAWKAAPKSPTSYPPPLNFVPPAVLGAARVGLVVEENAGYSGCLNALVRHTETVDRNFELSLVVFVGSSVPSLLSESSAKARVPLVHIDPSETTDLFADLSEKLKNIDCEFVCWKRAKIDERLEQQLCQAWRGRLLSTIPSLQLPTSQSARPTFDPNDIAQHELVLRMNLRFHGTTCHLIVPDVEQSLWPIVWQEMITLEGDETAEMLRDTVTNASCEGKAYVEALRALATGKIHYKPGHGVRRNKLSK